MKPMANNYQPLMDYVIVKKINGDVKSVGGILLPEQHQPKNRGEVIAVGPGTLHETGLLIAIALRVGDKVMFTRAHDLEGDQLLVKETDILCKY
jgi:chaperonin GroES